MSIRPLVSICIPTYNRADVLSKCLESIVTDPAFSNLVEVVVSDNCSTDKTAEVVTKYSQSYPNVKYYKTDCNIGGDRNFIRVLELGSGFYLKLLNDYSVFTPGGLQFLLNCVESNIKEKPVLYISRMPQKTKHEILYSLDDIALREKWGLSWIGNYGFWFEDFNEFEDKDKRIDTNFQQFDWLVRSFHKKRAIAYYAQSITTRMPFKAKQGDYNFFRVHTRNYFIQFEELKAIGEISSSTLEEVKKDVLHGLTMWIVTLRLEKGKYNYTSDGYMKILRSEFKQYRWYYYIIFKGVLDFIKNSVLYNIIIPLYRSTVKRFIHKYVKRLF